MGKNQQYLIKFSEFCISHPELRFWQAMLAWVQETQPKVSAILKYQRDPGGIIKLPQQTTDTFYEE